MKNIPLLLLIALVAFGCQEEIGVIGCTDELAYNFNADAEVDNGNCQYIEGCTDPAALNYNEYAMIMDGSCLYEGEGGGETNENPNDPCEGQNVLTYDGHDYPLIAVGSQCWMKENLRTTVTNAGVDIPIDTLIGNQSGNYGHMAFYQNDTENGHALYNGFGNLLGQVCPVGWRNAGYDDLSILSEESGVSTSELGHRLKATQPLWDGVDQFGLSFLNQNIVLSDSNEDVLWNFNNSAQTCFKGGSNRFGLRTGDLATFYPEYLNYESHYACVRCIKE